jgi:hypothetical protein
MSDSPDQEEAVSSGDEIFVPKVPLPIPPTSRFYGREGRFIDLGYCTGDPEEPDSETKRLTLPVRAATEYAELANELQDRVRYSFSLLYILTVFTH